MGEIPVTAPAEPVPTLELPSQALMQWSQMAMMLAWQLASRRQQMQRLAWSEAEHATRRHDFAEARVVRAMTPVEITQWPGGTGDPGPDARISAEVARMNGRWALRATARHEDGTVGQVWVSCRDERLARQLAQEITRRGEPELVGRLSAHIARGEALAAHHAHSIRATAVDREAMAAHVQDAWSAEVAAAVLGCPAWPTLAYKMTVAQRDGHDLARLLGGITTQAIPGARKPAAFASWLLDNTTAGNASPRHQEILAWADQLDPTSSVDRAGVLGVIGYDATIDEQLLTRFPALTGEAPGPDGQATADSGLADDRERSAAAHAATIDDPVTPRREDLDGQALAERDRHEAAALRATAAESHAAAHAAVARANVTLTPHGHAIAGPASTAHVAPPSHPQPPAPTRMPGRTR